MKVLNLYLEEGRDILGNIAQGLKLYFPVYPDLSHNTDILIDLTMDLLLQ